MRGYNLVQRGEVTSKELLAKVAWVWCFYFTSCQIIFRNEICPVVVADTVVSVHEHFGLQTTYCTNRSIWQHLVFICKLPYLTNWTVPTFPPQTQMWPFPKRANLVCELRYHCAFMQDPLFVGQNNLQLCYSLLLNFPFLSFTSESKHVFLLEAAQDKI